MLEKIKCEKFIEQSINFHAGLNVVLGDDIASNSIGKSTLLMIIDFAFGGSDYINKNKDALEQLGQHSFNFIFNFNGNRLFFTRSTENYRTVLVCNQKFEELSSISLDEYTNILQKEYKCQLNELSFRNIIGRYFRVYGKENLNEKKPIQYFEKETSSRSIITLIKLFNNYTVISEYEKAIDKLTEEKEILNSATKKNLIPNITKSIFNKNQDKINELKKQLDNLKSEIITSSLDIETIISTELLKLKNHKASLTMRQNILELRKSRILSDIENESMNLSPELEQFSLYFPDFNIEKIKEVDAFHSNLSRILKKELQTKNIEIQNQITEITNNIRRIDSQIINSLNIKDAPKFAVDKIVELSTQIQQLTVENGYFSKLSKITVDLKELKQNLSQMKKDILDKICEQINNKMHELNEIIYNKERRSPILQIEDAKYAFKTYGDTGTGTAFANLITFDLALLGLTCLPAIAHDLPLLKNIENSAMKKIIELYSKSPKQIFIAIDKIHSYDEKTVKIVESHRVVQLSKDQTLFIKNWKNNI